MRRLSLMMVLLLAALLVSLDPYRAERHATAGKRRSRFQTSPVSTNETVAVREVASPIVIGLQDGARQGGIRWLALGEKNFSLFHIDPQRLRRYMQ